MVYCLMKFIINQEGFVSVGGGTLSINSGGLKFIGLADALYDQNTRTLKQVPQQENPPFLNLQN